MSFKVGDQVQFQVWNQDINSILEAGQVFMLTRGGVCALWNLSVTGLQSLFEAYGHIVSLCLSKLVIKYSFRCGVRISAPFCGLVKSSC